MLFSFPIFFLYLKVWISALCKKVSQRVKEVKILRGSEKEQFPGNTSRGAGFQHLEDYIEDRTLQSEVFTLFTMDQSLQRSLHVFRKHCFKEALNWRKVLLDEGLGFSKV